MNLKKLNREQLNALATDNGVEDPESFETNATLIAKLQEVMPSESNSASTSPSEEAKEENEVEEVAGDGLVEVVLPKEDYSASAPEVVTINGVRTEIPLGVPTKVSPNVVEVLKNSSLKFEITNKEIN